jgi:hypothetical protein
MSFKNETGSWSAWENFSATKTNWALTAGDGSKTVTARVMDNAGNISLEASASITVDTQAPSSFALSSPANNTWQSSATPTLTWSASSDAGVGLAKYQLFIDVADPGNPGTPNRDNIASGTTSTTPSAPLSRGNHTWFIRAVDNAGNTTNSIQVYNVGYDNTLPARVSNFSATTTENTRVVISWSAYNQAGNLIAVDGGAPATGFKLERVKYVTYQTNDYTITSDWSGAGEDYAVFSGCGALTGDKINFVEIVDQPHQCDQNQPMLVQGVKYVYRISAKKADSVNVNYGPVGTGEVFGMTRDSDPPGSPTNVAGNADNGFQITVSWSRATDAGSGISKYLIWRSTDGVINSSHWTVVGVKDVPNPLPLGYALTWIDNDANNAVTDPTYKPVASVLLNDDTDYYYRVTAVDSATPPNPQDPTLTLFPSDPTLNVTQSAVTTPDNTAPAAPSGMTGAATIDTGHTDKQKVTLTWPGAHDWKKYGDHNVDCTVSNASGTDQAIRDANCGRLVRGYKLWFAADSGGAPGAWTAANGGAEINATTFTIDNLEETAYYWFRLKSVDNAGNESEFGTNYRKLTSSSQVPQPPTNVRVTAQNNPNLENFGKQLKIEFNDGYIKGKLNGNSITGYRLYRWQLSPSYNPGTETPTWDAQDVTNLTSIHDWNVTLEGDTFGTETYEYTDVIPETDENKADAKLYVYRVVSVGINPSIEPDPAKRIMGQLSSVDYPSRSTYGWDILADNEAPKLSSESIEVKNTKQSETEYRNIITWPLYTSSTRNGVSDFASYTIYRYENEGADLATVTPVKTITDSGENFWVDRITIAAAGEKRFYYAVVASDNASTAFRYPNNGPIVANHANTVRYPGSPNITPLEAYPTVTAVSNDAPGVASVRIHWDTNQPTDSVVEYQKMGGEIQGVIMDRTAMKSAGHSVAITGLEKNTSYQYRIISRNNLGNIDPAEDGKWNHSFKTEDFSIQNPRAPKEEVTTTNATIYWETPIEADSDVEYKPENSTEKSLGKSDKQMVKNHKLILENLKAGANYTFKIRSITADKFVAETQFMTFTTPAFDSSQFVIQPNASNVAEQNITATSAKIVWNTSVPTIGCVNFDTAPLNGREKYPQQSCGATYNTVHVIELLNLTPGRTYYYTVEGTDMNKTTYTSKEYQFTAVLKPEIQNLKVDVTDSYNAKVTFSTNVDTESSVSYGENGQIDQKAGTATVGKAHVIELKNLNDGSTYSVVVEVKDKLSNTVKSNAVNFQTPIDKTGAKVSGVKIDLLPMGESDETAQAIISWSTDKPTTTKIEYDEGVLGGKYSKSSIEDNSLNTSHTVIVKELNPSATYHFKIAGKDKRGNATTSLDYTFVTPNKEKSVLQLILKSLEETFSWVKNVGSFFSGIGKKTK